MRDLVERIEELLYMQERLFNVLFLSQSQKARVSINTAFDLLYHNIELLDLIQELLSNPEIFQEEYSKDYSMNLILEALSWMGVILPAIEESCPIFLHGVGFRGRDPFQRIMAILKNLEDVSSRSEYKNLVDLIEELGHFSGFLKHQITVARRAYMNLA
ncbi:MAG: hypothetical protein N3D14_05560 [Aquificaceae bacterium]|nr:hypothetical protein [Aquificaceae bacterium]MCX8164845.1 hypothetical protein [Aquificaceae bacterium]